MALVWLMIPGVGFFYSGLLRRKNALSMIFTSLASIAVVSFQVCFDVVCVRGPGVADCLFFLPSLGFLLPYFCVFVRLVVLLGLLFGVCRECQLFHWYTP